MKFERHDSLAVFLTRCAEPLPRSLIQATDIVVNAFDQYPAETILPVLLLHSQATDLAQRGDEADDADRFLGRARPGDRCGQDRVDGSWWWAWLRDGQ